MRGAATRSAESTSRSMHRITHAQANPDFSVDLEFEDGRQARVNLSEVVESAAVAAPLPRSGPICARIGDRRGRGCAALERSVRIARRQLALSGLPRRTGAGL